MSKIKLDTLDVVIRRGASGEQIYQLRNTEPVFDSRKDKPTVMEKAHRVIVQMQRDADKRAA